MSYGKKFRKLASVVCSFLMGSSGFSSAASLSSREVTDNDYKGVIKLAESVKLESSSFDGIKKQIKDLNKKVKILRFVYDNGEFGGAHSFLIKFGNDEVEFIFGRAVNDESVCAIISLDDFCLLAKYYGFRIDLFNSEKLFTTKDIFDVEAGVKFEFLRFLRCLVSGESYDESKEVVQKFIKSPEEIFKDSFLFCESGEAPYLFSIGHKDEFGSEYRIIDFRKYLTYLVSLIKLRGSGLSEEEIDKKIKEISKPAEKPVGESAEKPVKIPVKEPIKKGIGKAGAVCIGVGGLVSLGGIAYGLYKFSNKASGKQKNLKKRIKKQKKLSKKVNRVN